MALNVIYILTDNEYSGFRFWVDFRIDDAVKPLEIRHECVAILSLIDGHRHPDQPTLIPPRQSGVGRNIAFLRLLPFEGRGSNGVITGTHLTIRIG